MKKVININFHSRVIPIEESAYDILKKYVDKLRRHFANEEGADEIVNDIENRFAELFSDKLKKGAVCVTDADVNEIITSMGNPEEFDQEENTFAGQSKTTTESVPFAEAAAEPEHRSLYRSSNDKILGGVCAGIAAYFKIDPSIVRIVYALLTLGSFGALFLIYIIFWAVLPLRNIESTVRKRLYRNPDQRVIGGVASGIAAYLHIDVWIPRIIFAAPFILGLVAAVFHNMWFDYDGGLKFFSGGVGGSFAVTYIILWMLVPEAITASEKLEMRGEKIDIESIKNMFKNDVGGIKTRAAVISAEIKERAQHYSNDIKQKAPEMAASVNNIRRSNGFGHAIGVLFRAFFLFIGAIIAFALVVALIGLIFSGATVLPLKNYFLSGFWEHLLAWSVFFLVLCVPIIGILTFFIRRIIGARSKRNYLGYTFGGLWTIGLICFFILFGKLTSNFRMRSGVGDEIQLSSPVNGKMVVKVREDKTAVYDQEWLGIHWDRESPFYNVSEDSIMMNTVRVDIVKSDDNAWHVHRDRFSRAPSLGEAKKLASQIDFTVEQRDSLLYLAEGFAITPTNQFRNQQVRIEIQVPVGKKILMDEGTDKYRWFNVDINRGRHRWDNDEEEWSSNDHDWESGEEYVMTQDGLVRASSVDNPARPEKAEKSERTEQKERKEKKEQPEPARTDSGYRYHQDKPSARVEKPAVERESISPLEILTKSI